MNTEQIEELLRKAPAPKVSEGLLKKLTADVRVPRAAETRPSSWNRPPSWARRWLPPLSFATIFLACLVAIAVQTNKLAELDRQNNELRAAKTNLEALRVENAEYQKLARESQELDRLRKDNAELKKLREEVAQLTAQIKGAAQLQAENKRLQAQIAASGVAAGELDEDAYAQAKARAECIACANNLKQIGLAARIWAGDNNDIYPSNFICMTNELATWKVLQCPSDKSHHVTNWAEVVAGNISYQMLAPGIGEDNPYIVFVECPIHHNIALADGSVQRLSEENYRTRLKVVNGRKVFAP